MALVISYVFIARPEQFLGDIERQTRHGRGQGTDARWRKRYPGNLEQQSKSAANQQGISCTDRIEAIMYLIPVPIHVARWSLLFPEWQEGRQRAFAASFAR